MVTHVPEPEPSPGEVQIAVRCASLHVGDAHLVRGRPWFLRFATGLWRPKNPGTGLAIAGTITRVGAGVSEWSPGDRVFTELPIFDGRKSRGLAELAVAPSSLVARLPDGLSFELGASLFVSGTTAFQALLDDGGLQDSSAVRTLEQTTLEDENRPESNEPGQRVLIVGASGAIGTFAV